MVSPSVASALPAVSENESTRVSTTKRSSSIGTSLQKQVGVRLDAVVQADANGKPKGSGAARKYPRRARVAIGRTGAERRVFALSVFHNRPARILARCT